MAYEIVMPQLSDSMEEGKLVAWKVKEGTYVKKGDVIAEIESDKAIMEVQSFKEGVVANINITEGASVKVGTVIAVIETKEVQEQATQEQATQEYSEKIPENKNNPKAEEILAKTESKAQNISLPDETPLPRKTDTVPLVIAKGMASPKAKVFAAQHNLNIQVLQETKKLSIPTHEEEIKNYAMMHYFTPKARKLLALYQLDPTLFAPGQKYDSSAVMTRIKAENTPFSQPLESFQKTLISFVTRSAQKPVYHIYDHVDAILFKEHKKHTITVWLIKLFAHAIMEHDVFRSTLLDEETIQVWPNASVCLAIAHGKYLYMPVFKNANLLSLTQIDMQLENFIHKAKENTMAKEDFQGSTFGLSNLGMTGVERFDAMISQNDSGIAAIGSISQGKLSITLTLDHRLINGYQGAAFMQTLKVLAQDPFFFKE